MLRKILKSLFTTSGLVIIIIGVCLSLSHSAQPAKAISLGSDVHSQGATITKDYFIYTALDSSNHTDIFRCDRNGTDFDNCKVIVSGDFGHANVLDHEWGTDYFYVDGGGCYTLSGEKASSSNCKAPANWTVDNAGLTGQGRTQYGNYRLKAFGNTHNTHSRIVVRQKSGSGYKTIEKIDINDKPVVLDDYSPEIEDVAVDGDTGEIYYTMSGWFDYQGGDQEVRLYKVDGYTLPASGSNNSLKSGAVGVCSNGLNLPDQQAAIFSQNNLSYWNPCECTPKGGGSSIISSNSCFKIDDSVGVQDRWYAEGEIGAAYASVVYTSTYNDFLIGDTKIDEDFGGLQYIYAENYDIEYDGYEGWIPKFTKKSDANSTRKYYWIVLPSESYSNGFGETYVATFENLSEPVYFITYDTHGTEAEVPARYKSEAEADPNGVAIKEEFFGALAKGAGNYTEAANKAGKLTSFCRINGRGEVLAASNGSANNIAAKSENSSSSSGSSSTPLTAGTSSDLSSSAPSSGSSTTSEDGSNVTIIGDSMTQYDLEFHGGFIKKKLPNADIHYQNGKGFKEYDGDNKGGLTILKELADQNKLRKILVFALGSNNGGRYQLEQSDIDKLLDYAKNCDQIILLTNYKSTNDSFFDTNNALFKKAADSNDKVTLVDWKAEASKDPSKYIAAEGDFGIHPTKEGSELRANMIYDAITNGGNCDDGNGDVLKAVETIIELANANGSTYSTDGANRSQEDFDAMLSGKKSVDVDCTAFASLVMYKAFGKMALFCSGGISSVPEYEEVTPKSDAKPGDVFVYGPCGSGGHGGIVVEVKDGQVTKVAETGGSEGRSGSNNNIGYSTNNYTVQKVNSSDGHIYRWKGSGEGSSNGNKKCNNNNNNNNYCPDGSGSGGGGNESYNGTGLTDEQAEKLAANYNNNTDNWDSKAGAGLFCEGECASKYSNCSLMSAFFVEMFTSVGTGQAWSGMYGGNVVNVLSGMGFRTGSKPEAFSIFSCGPTDWGHTGVVVRVDGDSITTVEAGYPNMVGQKSNMGTCSGMGYGTATYAYLNDKMDIQKLMDFINK